MIYIGTPDGKELHKLETIDSISLETEEDEGSVIHNPRTENYSFEGRFSICGHENLDIGRFFASGMNQGIYNGIALREDGYLSPENGWIE